MNANTPRNAQQAIAQANRFDRARQIIKEGYTFTDMGDGGIAVCKPGKLAASYWIDGPFCKGCDCPDATKNGNRCKHMLAWESINAEEAAELEGLEAQCAEYDALHGPDMPPTDTTRALMLAEFRKSERALAACDEPFSTRAENARQRMREVETALRIYDEVTTKILCDYYKRNLDKPKACA